MRVFLENAIRLGVCKINLGTELRLAFIRGMRTALEKAPLTDPEEILGLAEQEMENFIRNKMKVYGWAAKSEKRWHLNFKQL